LFFSCRSETANISKPSTTYQFLLDWLWCCFFRCKRHTSLPTTSRSVLMVSPRSAPGIPRLSTSPIILLTDPPCHGTVTVCELYCCSMSVNKIATTCTLDRIACCVWQPTC
jgi:hypothetical protein